MIPFPSEEVTPPVTKMYLVCTGTTVVLQVGETVPGPAAGRAGVGRHKRNDPNGPSEKRCPAKIRKDAAWEKPPRMKNGKNPPGVHPAKHQGVAAATFYRPSCRIFPPVRCPRTQPATLLEWLADPNTWISLLTLTALEIVLGVDNIIFISILAAKLPAAQQARARMIGLGLALFGRVALLLSLSWIMRLTAPLFNVLHQDISGRDLILLLGGLFLLYKSTHEIHDKLEGDTEAGHTPKAATFAGVIAQILVLDLVFSLDSVITAVGMANQIPVMVAAMVIAIVFMMFSAKAVSDFIHEHPTVKMLALAFLLMIGVALIGEGLDFHIPKGYIYFAMAFSVLVEMLNLRVRRRQKPVELRETPHLEST